MSFRQAIARLYGGREILDDFVVANSLMLAIILPRTIRTGDFTPISRPGWFSTSITAVARKNVTKTWWRDPKRNWILLTSLLAVLTAPAQDLVIQKTNGTLLTIRVADIDNLSFVIVPLHPIPSITVGWCRFQAEPSRWAATEPVMMKILTLPWLKTVSIWMFMR